jgi:hypothetical protein
MGFTASEHAGYLGRSRRQTDLGKPAPSYELKLLRDTLYFK